MLFRCACVWTFICVCAHVPEHLYVPQCARRSEDSPGYWSLPFTLFQEALLVHHCRPRLASGPFPISIPQSPSLSTRMTNALPWLCLGSGKFELSPHAWVASTSTCSALFSALILSLETGFHYVSQTTLKLRVLLPQCP